MSQGPVLEPRLGWAGAPGRRAAAASPPQPPWALPGLQGAACFLGFYFESMSARLIFYNNVKVVVFFFVP